MSEEELRARHVKHVNLTLTGFSQAFEDGLYTTSWTRAWAPRLGIDLGATAEWLAREVVGSAEQPHSWLATVAPYLSPEHVERVSNSMLRLHLVGIDGTGWYPAFDVRFTDAVSIGAPFWATENNLTANPPYANLTLDVSVPRVSVLSNLVGGFVSVSELRARSHSLQLVLSGGEWALDAGRPGHAAYEALSRALVGPDDLGPISGISRVSAGLLAGSSGWQLAARGRLRATRENASHLTLSIPPLPAYRIDAPETVHVTVPALSLIHI